MNLRFDATSYAFTQYAQADNWIGGSWSPAAGERLDVINPRYGRAMSTVCMSGMTEVDAAVKAAKTAFASWKELPWRERATIFYQLRSLMHRDLEELTWLVSHENGKT